MIKALVTGADGFIGSHLVDSLLHLKCHVLAISRGLPGLLLSSSLQDPLLTTLNLSINDYSQLNHALVGIDIVIHLASSSLPQTSNDNPISDVNSNLIGSLNILKSCVNNKIRHWYFKI